MSAERVTIEYLAENGLRQDEIPFQITEIGHLWEPGSVVATQSARVESRLSLVQSAAGDAATSGLSLAAVSKGPGREIAGCHLDVACFPEFRTIATGVARILFSDQGGVYSCSGALVNTKSGNGTPLFLTASHCIDNEASARSVQANFFYESDTCGGGLRQVEDVLGANYLISETFSRGDYSLIRLLGLPKSSVYFFGITTDEPAIGTKLTGIHHPEGSYKRISFGPRTPDESIGVSDGTGIFVSPADRYYQVDQREGRTEGGSSGSPLLNPKKQLIGILSSGPVFSGSEAEDEVLMCLADKVIDQYGRVSKAWPNLETFINDLRPGRMALPQAGDKFTSKKVKFQWSPGVGVTEFRLLVGKSNGGAEYADVKLPGSESSYTTENLPENGSQIFGRLMSNVDGKWEIADYAYLASSGSPARAARIQSPAVNAQLDSSQVEFKWDEGSNVSEYMLYVGASPGGIEFARANVGKQTSTVVRNLPGNGQNLYARLFSRLSGGWTYSDAIYRAADTQAKTFTLKISNRLAYPVAVLVNERVVMSVLGGSSAEQSVPRTAQVTVEWRLVRPLHPDTRLPLGDNLGATLATVTPADSLSFEIDNAVNGSLYFTPIVSNSTANQSFNVEVNNGTPSRAALGAIAPRTQNAGLGYHRVQLSGSVRAYYGLAGYSGPYVETAGVAARIEDETGIVRIDLSLPAQP